MDWSLEVVLIALVRFCLRGIEKSKVLEDAGSILKPTVCEYLLLRRSLNTYRRSLQRWITGPSPPGLVKTRDRLFYLVTDFYNTRCHSVLGNYSADLQASLGYQYGAAVLLELYYEEGCEGSQAEDYWKRMWDSLINSQVALRKWHLGYEITLRKYSILVDPIFNGLRGEILGEADSSLSLDLELYLDP